MSLFDDKFEELVAGVLGGLADLEQAALRAPAYFRQREGRPAGTGVLPHDFIVNLESTYHDCTGKRGGAGPGPFARFVLKFLEAVGRESTEATVIEAIKEAKKREERNPASSRWGRSWLAIRG